MRRTDALEPFSTLNSLISPPPVQNTSKVKLKVVLLTLNALNPFTAGATCPAVNFSSETGYYVLFFLITNPA